MAVISFHNVELSLDLNPDAYYAECIDPEMFAWLCEHVGPPILEAREVRNYTKLDHQWSLVKAFGPRCYDLHLDTTENIAVEFKLRWL